MEKIFQQLEKHQILNQVILNKHSTFEFTKPLSSSLKTNQNQSVIIGCSKSVPKEILLQLKKNLRNLQIKVQIKYLIGIGQKLKPYHNLFQVFSDQQANLQHNLGQILLIDIWSTRCAPCQESMSLNQKILQKNQSKWKNKVRFIALSIDSQKQAIKQRINLRGWNKMQHLTFLKWNDEHPLIQDFQIRGIPFIILVDKHGKINFTGNPSEINIEQTIDELLENSEEQSNFFKESQNMLNLSQKNEIQLKQEKILERIFQKQFFIEKDQQYPVFFINAEQNLQIINRKITKNSMKIFISTDQNTPQLIDDIKNLFRKFNPSSYKIELNPIQIQTIPQKENLNCSQCKNKLQFPFYWCKWDENTFRCRNCVERKSQKDNQFYFYDKNAILLTSSWQYVYRKNLGKNLQPQGSINQEHRNLFGCNSCGNCPQKVGQARYICTICNFDPKGQNEFCDLCQQCVDSIIQRDQVKIKELEQNGHDPAHPLLRVLYRVNDYSEF